MFGVFLKVSLPLLYVGGSQLKVEGGQTGTLWVYFNFLAENGSWSSNFLYPVVIDGLWSQSLHVPVLKPVQ